MEKGVPELFDSRGPLCRITTTVPTAMQLVVTSCDQLGPGVQGLGFGVLSIANLRAWKIMTISSV